MGPSSRSSTVALLLTLLLTLTLSAPVSAADVETIETTEPGQRLSCLVCPKPIEGEHVVIEHRGRRVHLHPGDCVDVWHSDPDRYFRAMQPNAALFDEDALRGDDGNGWLYLGLYVLSALFCGGFCSYTAISRGRSAVEWFFLGLAFNVLAIAAVLLKPVVDTSALPAGIPAGLRKVPQTREPVRCPACGAEAHPSASRCAACGAALEPLVQSEVERA